MSEDHIPRTPAEIRSASIVNLLRLNNDLKNQLRRLYKALGLDFDATTHTEAVAVCEALRGLYDETVGAEG